MVEITAETRDGIHELIVVGEIDASSSIHLDNAISATMENGHQKIMVNCEGLNYISSAGLGVFMSYLDDFEAKEVKFVICGLNEKVNHVFELLGLENLIKIVATKAEAQAYLNDSQA